MTAAKYRIRDSIRCNAFALFEMTSGIFQGESFQIEFSIIPQALQIHYTQIHISPPYAVTSMPYAVTKTSRSQKDLTQSQRLYAVTTTSYAVTCAPYAVTCAPCEVIKSNTILHTNFTQSQSVWLVIYLVAHH